MTLATHYSRESQRSVTSTGRMLSTFGTAVPAGTGSHVLSAGYTVLSAATAHDTFWLTVNMRGSSAAGTRTDALLNLYVGASGEERVLVPNMLAGWAEAIRIRSYQFPLYIPAGSRLTAKSQALVSAQPLRVWLELEGGGRYPNWVGRGVECLGANVAGSFGVSVLMGTTSEGIFTSVGTTTTQWGYVLPMIQGTLSDLNMASCWVGADVGSNGAQLGDLADFPFMTNGSEFTQAVAGGFGGYYPVPSGTGIQVRLQSSLATAETLDVCVYGVY